MAIEIYDGSTWRNVSAIKINNGDVSPWQNTSAGFIHDGSTWRPFMSAVVPSISPSSPIIGGTLTLYRGSDLSGTYAYALKRADNVGMTTNVSTVKSGTLTGSTINTTYATSVGGGDTNKYFQLEVTYLGTVYKSNIVRVVKNAPVFTTDPYFYDPSTSQTITSVAKGAGFVVKWGWDSNEEYSPGSYTIDISTDTDGSIYYDSGTISSGATLTRPATGTVSVAALSSATLVTTTVTLTNTGGDTTKITTMTVISPPIMTTSPTFSGTGQSGTTFTITPGAWTNADSVTAYIEYGSASFTDASLNNWSSSASIKTLVSNTYSVTNTDATTNSYYFRGVVVATNSTGGRSYWISNTGNLTSLSGATKSWIQPVANIPTLEQFYDGLHVSWSAGPSGYIHSNTIKIYDVTPINGNPTRTLAATISSPASSPYIWTGGTTGKDYLATLTVVAEDYNAYTSVGYTTAISSDSNTVTLVTVPSVSTPISYNLINGYINSYFTTGSNTSNIRYKWFGTLGTAYLTSGSFQYENISSNTAYVRSFNVASKFSSRTFYSDTWNSATIYSVGNTVYYIGDQYTAAKATPSAYNSGSPYFYGNQVSYNGNVYIAIASYIPPGSTPTAYPSYWSYVESLSVYNTNYWTKTTTNTYNVGDYVSYGGTDYVCYVDGTTGIYPTNTLYWQVFNNYGSWHIEVLPYTGGLNGEIKSSSPITIQRSGTADTVTVTQPTFSGITQTSFTTKFTPNGLTNRVIIDIKTGGSSISGYPQTLTATAGTEISHTPSNTLTAGTTYIVYATPRYLYGGSAYYDGTQTNASTTTLASAPTITTGPSISPSGTATYPSNITATAGTYTNAGAVTTVIVYGTTAASVGGIASGNSGLLTSTSGTPVGTKTSPYTLTAYDVNPPAYYYATRDTFTGTNGTTYYCYSAYTLSQKGTQTTPTVSNFVAGDGSFTATISGQSGASFSANPVSGTGTLSVNGTTVSCTGMGDGGSKTFTITAYLSGYNDATSSSYTGYSLNAALTPTFGTNTSGTGQFTGSVTNYDANYTWSISAGVGSVSWGIQSGSTRPFTVTGLSSGQSSTVTVGTSRTGYKSGSAQTTGSAYVIRTLSYDANGGTGAPSSQTTPNGTQITISSTTPTRTDYSFSKWNTASGGSGTDYNPGGVITLNSDITLYAQWTANVPVNTVTPTITPSSGTATYTSFSVNSNGTWTNNPTTYTYQWQSNISGSFADVSGQTSSSWTPGSTYGGYSVRCKVTASNSAASGVAYTSASSVAYYPQITSWRAVDKATNTGIYYDSQTGLNCASIVWTLYGRNSTGSAWSVVTSGTSNIPTSAGSHIAQSTNSSYLYFYLVGTAYSGAGGTGFSGATKTGASFTVSLSNASATVLGTE